jgi:bifunctional UDP-N-acetylglucosamine pyrophosphorylase/glucosamine-1-phosphate N-acetyltransferase
VEGHVDQPLSVVVLAAGEGKRFRSALPKPLHAAAGRPLLWHVLAAAEPLRADPVVVVAGRGADQVRSAVEGFGFERVRAVTQPEPLGTGDALAAALPALPAGGPVLVLCGDTPLLRSETLHALVGAHRAAAAAMTMLTCEPADPSGYGRVLRAADGAVTGIVEERDATPAQRAITEVNAGVYVFERAVLELLGKLQPDNRQGEYYLPDLLGQVRAAGGTVVTVPGDALDLQGVNDRAQLAAAGAELRHRLLGRLMADGVTVVDPASTYVDVGVEVGRDTVLLPLTFLEGGTRVGAGCTIGPNARLVGCVVGDGASVTQAVGNQARIGERALVGPFAYLRPGAELEPGSKVGTYVEVKASRIGAGSKVPHLTYVGDAEIAERVNVGAGTVFVNYDGHEKHRASIGPGAFIGSDTMLVAPISIGAGAQTAAGSTITRDVPPGALAIGRAEQRTIEGWVERRRRRRARPGGGSEQPSSPSAAGRTDPPGQAGTGR